MDIPPLTTTTEFNESEWYPLTKKLELVESCDGIENAAENCNALEYRVQIQATSGNLRIKLREEDTLSDTIKQRS